MRPSRLSDLERKVCRTALIRKFRPKAIRRTMQFRFEGPLVPINLTWTTDDFQNLLPLKNRELEWIARYPPAAGIKSPTDNRFRLADHDRIRRIFPAQCRCIPRRNDRTAIGQRATNSNEPAAHPVACFQSRHPESTGKSSQPRYPATKKTRTGKESHPTSSQRNAGNLYMPRRTTRSSISAGAR